MKSVKVKPSSEEVNAAIEAQAPSPQRNERGEDKPVPRSNTFAQLAKVSRSAQLAIGGAAQWVKPEQMFNVAYKNGDESVPFYITKAWSFTSKQGFGQRLGLEVVFSNGRMYNVALGLNDGDSKRNSLILQFEQSAAPIGPFVMVKLPLNKGNDYYDIVPQETENESGVAFAEINDADIPF